MGSPTGDKIRKQSYFFSSLASLFQKEWGCCLVRSDRIKGRFAQHGLLIISARVLDFELEMLVDTGASYCALRRNIAERLGLKIDLNKSIKIVPAASQPILTPFLKITKMQVGGIISHNVDAIILDFPRELRFAGVLGMNFMQKFRMCIEPDTATLVLRKLK